MNAKDKIYRNYFGITASEEYLDEPIKDADEITEYINKDSLIAWLYERQSYTIAEIIEKIKEL